MTKSVSGESSQPITGASVQQSVGERYASAAQALENSLCCPIEYDARYLEVIPKEVIERDYGCGDPSRFAKAGDTVLDLGSGGGKICFIAAQIVGPGGKVIGVDMTGAMLDLARKSAPDVAHKIGYANVEFKRGHIQDLRLDLDQVERFLSLHPVRNTEELEQLEAHCDALRLAEPMIPDASVDLVVSNCVLNLVRDQDKKQLLGEIFRVLRRGGRIAISDIVSDEAIPESLKANQELWSGCISGAFQEKELLQELESLGFYGIQMDQWSETPFAVVEGIEFRSLTITAVKGKDGPCLEANQAVVYRGPWKEVEDDDGHRLRRGERVAVCAKTFEILCQPPYSDAIVPIQPTQEISEENRVTFDCSRAQRRDPSESKRGAPRITDLSGPACCEPDSCC